MANPLSDIDTLVAAALTGFTALTALVPESRIQLYDREIDIRQMEGATGLGSRIWVVPLASDVNLTWSSGRAEITRRYAVHYGSAGLKLSDCREIEWQIMRALTRLFEGVGPDGVTPITQPTPLQIENVSVGASDPEREPMLDPEEWRDVCDVSVMAFVARADLLADPP